MPVPMMGYGDAQMTFLVSGSLILFCSGRCRMQYDDTG